MIGSPSLRPCAMCGDQGAERMSDAQKMAYWESLIDFL